MTAENTTDQSNCTLLVTSLQVFCVKSCFNLVQETCTVKNCARMRVTFKKLLQVSGTSSATRFLIMCHPYNSDDDADKSVTLERL